MACGAGEGAAAAGPRLAHYECAECLAARELLRAQAAEREQLARVERELRRIEQVHIEIQCCIHYYLTNLKMVRWWDDDVVSKYCRRRETCEPSN